MTDIIYVIRLLLCKRPFLVANASLQVQSIIVPGFSAISLP